MWRKILIDIWHGEHIKNLKETGQKRASYSSDVPHYMAYDSFTGVSWITCIGAKIICIYIYILIMKEKQYIWGIILRCLNPYLRQGYDS